MNKVGQPRIALVGAGGASFGPIMALDTVRAKGLAGCTLVLVDINEERLKVARAVAERMNEQGGNPINIETCTDTARGMEGADYVILSVEVGRWDYWQQDYDIPRKYGSKQDMAENGGPGGLFHSLRTIKLVLEICKLMEQVCPDALLINATNPLSRVDLAIDRATKIKTIGVCPELLLGRLRLPFYVFTPLEKIETLAAGMNHFTWYYEIKNADTGKDLYPRLLRHTKMAPFMHGKLCLQCYEDFGLYPVSSDSHIGEYLPNTGKNTRSVNDTFPYHKFSQIECSFRIRLTEWYSEGKFKLPMDHLPATVEDGITVVEALATGEKRRFGALNIPNTEKYIPNLPEWAIVEVPVEAVDGELKPVHVPPLPEPIAEHARHQYTIQSLVADSVINKDRAPAFQALLSDPLAPPTHQGCCKAFEELCELQKDVMPF